MIKKAVFPLILLCFLQSPDNIKTIQAVPDSEPATVPASIMEVLPINERLENLFVFIGSPFH